jgi:uncharacterized protein YndB with AHSA1/START domain
MFTVAAALAGTPADAPATQPGDEIKVVSSVIIHCPTEEIFGAFKTPEGIVKSWSVAKAKVDFRIGGQFRTSYQPDIDLDSPKAIGNIILAYEPDRMLAIKAIAPEGSPDWLKAICETGWSVLTLEKLAPDRTRVTCTGMGYAEGELYEKARSFFQQGNDMVLKMMKQKFDRPGAVEEAKKVHDLFRSRLNSGGGDAHWISDQKLPDGRTLRGHTAWREILGGKFIEVDGRLGDEKSMRSHAHLVCGIDLVLNSVFFHQAMETGAVARGTIQLLNENTAGGNWTFHSPQGEAIWYITFEFVDGDHYNTRMWKGDNPQGDPAMLVRYRRVNEVPPGF